MSDSKIAKEVEETLIWWNRNDYTVSTDATPEKATLKTLLKCSQWVTQKKKPVGDDDEFAWMRSNFDPRAEDLMLDIHRDVDKLGMVTENVSWRERNDVFRTPDKAEIDQLYNRFRTLDLLWSGGTLAARTLRYERVI
jgi:hypothetical protein